MHATLHEHLAVVSLLHVRLLFGLLTTLTCVNGWHTHTHELDGLADAQASQDACLKRIANSVLSLREERRAKVKNAPAHAAHMLPDALLAHETAPDDEEVVDWSVEQRRCFPAPLAVTFAPGFVRPLRPPQTQLERPPRV